MCVCYKSSLEKKTALPSQLEFATSDASQRGKKMLTYSLNKNKARVLVELKKRKEKKSKRSRHLRGEERADLFP